MPVNIRQPLGDQVCLPLRSYGADGRPPRIERPGTEELWLALNEAAYIRGDIEIDQFEHGLDAIWGSGVLPSWILQPLVTGRPRPPDTGHPETR